MQGNLGKQFARIASLEGFQQTLRALEENRPSVLAGLADGLIAPVTLLISAQRQGPVCLLVPDAPSADRLLGSLAVFASHVSKSPRVVLFPGYGTSPYLGASPHLAIMRDRIRCLHLLSQGCVDLLVLPVEAAAFLVPSPEQAQKTGLRLDQAQEIEREELVRRLEQAGYRRQSMVGARGDYAVRGGIVDLFSPQAERPWRIEFDGDAISSLRDFEPDSQRSTGEIQSVQALSIREFVMTGEQMSQRFSSEAGTLWREDRFSADVEAKLEGLETRGCFPGMEFFLPLFCEDTVPFAGHLEGWTLLSVESQRIEEQGEKLFAAIDQGYQQALARQDAVLEPSRITCGLEALRALIQSCSVDLCSIPIPGAATREVFYLRSQPQRKLSGSINEVIRELTSETVQKRDALVFLQSAGEAERFSNLLSEFNLPFVRVDSAKGAQQAHAGVVYLARGEIAEGFRCADANLVVYAEQELFGEVARRERRNKERSAAFLSDFRDLKPGDYVVHVDHGIGKFLGLEGIRSQDATSECMVIAYQNDDKLFVPLERLDLVHRYSGTEGARPRLDTLGGKTWARTKQRIKRSMRDLAQELLNLYAARSVRRGHVFPEDDHFQREFEEAFPFEETADQVEALREIKKDMESSRIMDRLLCGDVGYGKTEVAMRAAFKTVLGGKQVAVLVPTTVLAFQHYNTFRERLKMFPVTIEMISRFRSRAEQKKTLAELKEGKVDILVGTHRLLSKDVEFPNLGLLVVDEEQRFGVTHKERIKKMRKGVEVLTLTATPIPRTLHMSLTGIRDMSVINTPPQNRIAIETQVLPFGAQIIKEGIERELARGGQVYFVHNRVESIYTLASMLRRICPGARYGVGHGQMRERELEQVMIRFLAHEFDVLVATTIIENGLDIPNVNTIFMNRAHMFGLSQLYQLRGRVGRSDRPAYAYLLVPRSKKLTPEARKRLFAIQEFSDLGSGFRIAAMDLEIRGAGNILGREQHGQMMAVGFDMYMKLLQQTVRELKGEDGELEGPASVSLTVGAGVPVDYIEDANIRIMVYKRISSAQTEAEVAAAESELRDRFGPIPPQVAKLLGIQRVKLMATEMNVSRIDREGNVIRMKLHKTSTIDPDNLIEFLHARPEERKFAPSGLLSFRVPEEKDIIEATRDVLIELA